MTIDYSRAYPRLTDFFVKQIAHDACAHAYLLVGPRGIGKAALAEGFSKALVDAAFTQEKARSYFHIDATTEWVTRMHPDVVFLRPDENGHIGIDTARGFQRAMHERPMFGLRRVGVIVHGERLTHEAMASILKLLEEPPKNVIIILLGESLSAFPRTILSRCQHILVPRLPDEHIQSLLGLGNSPEEQMSLELAHGRIRFAASLVAAPELRERQEALMNEAIAFLEHRTAPRDLRSRMDDRDTVLGFFDVLEILCADLTLGYLHGATAMQSTLLKTVFLSIKNRLPLQRIVHIAHYISRGRELLAANVSPSGVFEQMLATV